MRCRKCDTALPEGSAFCLECGAPVGAPAAAPADLFPLLARANLLRMRGQWQEAVDLCAEVIRLSPRNASAHSLLGDIYENQGRLEDATHWYRLALDLAPGSEADAAKLARAQELAEARQRKDEWQAVIDGRQQPVLVASAVRESLQNVVMAVGAAIFGIILVMALLTSATARLPLEEPPLTPVARRPEPPSHRAYSEREAHLLRVLSAPEAMAERRGVLAGLAIDPRDQTAAVRLALPELLLRDAAAEDARELILREGYAAAHVLAWEDGSLGAIHIHVLGSPPGQRGAAAPPDSLFVGSLDAAHLTAPPSRMTASDLQALFSAVWWSGALAP